MFQQAGTAARPAAAGAAAEGSRVPLRWAIAQFSAALDPQKSSKHMMTCGMSVDGQAAGVRIPQG